MANYNGLIASLTKDGSDADNVLSGTSFVTVVSAVPGKFFPHGQFAIACTEGVSGGFSVDVIGGIGGATFAIATRRNITDPGSFPIPQNLFGFSGSQVSSGFPRPIGVDFIAGTTAAGTSWPVGFSASVYLAGEY